MKVRTFSTMPSPADFSATIGPGGRHARAARVGTEIGQRVRKQVAVLVENPLPVVNLGFVEIPGDWWRVAEPVERQAAVKAHRAGIGEAQGTELQAPVLEWERSEDGCRPGELHHLH